jgi:hypothetical protein
MWSFPAANHPFQSHLAPLVRHALVAVVNAFSVRPQAKMETKWKHRQLGRRIGQCNALI